MAKEKKKTKKRNKKMNLLILGVALILIVLGIVIALFTGKDDDEKDNNKNKEPEVVVNEETVENEYGFTKQDAIDAVKGRYNGDSYEFDAEVREDNMYIVTVTNPDTDSVHKYVVDPNNGAVETLK